MVSKVGLWRPVGLSPVRIMLAIVDMGEWDLDWDLDSEGVPGLEWNGVPMERD